MRVGGAGRHARDGPTQSYMQHSTRYCRFLPKRNPGSADDGMSSRLVRRNLQEGLGANHEVDEKQKVPLQHDAQGVQGNGAKQQRLRLGIPHSPQQEGTYGTRSTGSISSVGRGRSSPRTSGGSFRVASPFQQPAPLSVPSLGPSGSSPMKHPVANGIQAADSNAAVYALPRRSSTTDTPKGDTAEKQWSKETVATKTTLILRQSRRRIVVEAG